MSSFIPDSAPFNEEQRAWLNGFFAGLMGMRDADPGTMQAAFDSVNAAGLIGTSALVEEEEDFPWHDASLSITDRMELAKEKPIERKLMAAMAQLDCGSCGYLCQSYSEAIASGAETNLTLCSPGGKETKQMIKLLLKDQAPARSNGTTISEPTIKQDEAVYSRKKPFVAKLIESRTLNKPGSAKDVRHVAIDLAGSGLKYEVGDALGILPVNCPELVNELVQTIGASGGELVSSINGSLKSLSKAIAEDCCLREPTDELVELLLKKCSDENEVSTLKSYIADGTPAGVDVLELLQSHSCAGIKPQELVSAMGPMNPRLYSIASSMKHVGEQVHLTVGKVFYERNGRTRKGVASTLLADRVAIGETLRVFVQPNHGGFTVPSDLKAPMIMVGPGTGIAPFVAFLQERVSSKATGENWLFFGDQHEACDFLYQEMLEDYLAVGALTRLDTAFSRDGDKKIYVQDRMRENGKELWSWLERGAYFYVCGDASRMASDVDRALVSIVAQHGGMPEDEAIQYVKKLTASKRYVRDVY